MYVPYHTLPDNARVWIYQSNRKFTEEELVKVQELTVEFIEQWTRHGEQVKGSYTLVYDQFLMIAVDQEFVEVSGCSIDASVKLVQQFQIDFGVDMLNKLSIAYLEDDLVNVATISEFATLVKEGKVTEETLVFNNMIDIKKGLEEQWQIPAKESWQARFFN